VYEEVPLNIVAESIAVWRSSCSSVDNCDPVLVDTCDPVLEEKSELTDPDLYILGVLYKRYLLSMEFCHSPVKIVLEKNKKRHQEH